MPRTSTYPSTLLSLVQSTSYPPIPGTDELEVLRRTLSEHRQLKRKRDDTQIVIERHASPIPKRERSASPTGSVIAVAPYKPHTSSQPITYAGIKKKKKRPFESDDESRSVASPPAHHTTSTSGLKLKLNKNRPLYIDPSPTPSTSALPVPSTYGTHLDFSLPPAPSRPLVPPRPGVQKPPKPGPKRQADVDEDFSNTKAPTQTAQPTFWASVEPYLREIREDDLAMLNFKADAPESYEIPAKGKHYTEVWDEEDGLPIGTTPRLSVPSMRHNHGSAGGPSRLVPATDLREEHLVEENKGLGSLTERLIAGIVGGLPFSRKEAPAANPNVYDGNRDLTRLDVVDLEDRMKRELKATVLVGDQDEPVTLIGLWTDSWLSTNREDDEITAALRQCQRLLLEQTQINDARKSRLADIAQHRLAYAEYTTSLDGVEKSIELAWSKRVKKYGSTPKKCSPGAGANGDSTSGGRPPVSENVKKLVHVRQAWVDTVGQTMKARPKGEVVGIPEHSVYEGLGEEVDEKVVDDAVELASDEET